MSSAPLPAAVYTLVALCSACTLGAAVEATCFLGRGPAHPILTFPATLCYDLYMWHVTCGRVVRRLLCQGDFHVQTMAWLLLTFMVATASWHLVEKPILGPKQR